MLRDVVGENGPAPRLLCEGIGQPAAIGLLRPAIILPRQFAESEPAERLRTAPLTNLARSQRAILVFWPCSGSCCRSSMLSPCSGCFAARSVSTRKRSPTPGRQARTGRDMRRSSSHGRGSRVTDPPVLSAGALGLWERPSQLRRRIALLLDSSLEIEPHSPRRWRMFAWGIAGLLVVGLSLATFRPVVARVGPAVHADEPAGERRLHRLSGQGRRSRRPALPEPGCIFPLSRTRWGDHPWNRGPRADPTAIFASLSPSPLRPSRNRTLEIHSGRRVRQRLRLRRLGRGRTGRRTRRDPSPGSG